MDREEDAYIYGAAVADGALLLAGQFPTGAGRRAVVMRYQQGSWTPLGSWTGEDYYAYAVAVYKGHVVAGGHFPGCYTRPYQPGAGRWDGSSWRPMGAVNDDPEVFLVWDGALIMGGQFDFADNSGVNCIARWREGE